MSEVIILPETTKNPITLIGKMAGLCYGTDTSDNEKNYKRGLDCIISGHGRTIEFPDIYMNINGYSARVIREFYTHIGGAPTRLQSSTRYIDYSNFDYIIPPIIEKNPAARNEYIKTMSLISESLTRLVNEYKIPKEDAAMELPLGMTSDIVCKMNARTAASMSEQRLCSRAYWEYRSLMKDIINALCNYSDEWKELTELLFKCKCDKYGYCTENRTCGRYPKK